MSSPVEPRLARAFLAWNTRAPSVGDLAFGAFWLAVASGLLLSLAYEPTRALDSLELVALTNPAALYARALHYWSGQLFLLLTVLHLVEHLARGSERRVSFGPWLRLSLSLGIVGYLMVSGYVLKADAEGVLARQVLAGLLERLPLVGAPVKALLVGPEGQLHPLYLHHAATATLLSFAVIVEHFRRAWPSARAWLATCVACGTLALLLPPALHDGLSPVVKGPWYMLGVQELLHQLSSPAWLWLPAFLLLAALAALPWLAAPWAARAKLVLALALGGLGLLALVGHFLRGADWEWRSPLAPRPPAFDDPRLYWPEERVTRAEIPMVLGRREGCLACHADLRGFEASHTPEAVGCAPCHLGRRSSGNAAAAHAGMARVPGNLDRAAATCGADGCHAAIVTRVSATLMTTGAGLVGVDRFVFGEATDADGGGDLRALGASPADRHLDALCAGCHLGVVKAEPGPVAEDSRGGGCTACHLNYGDAARGDDRVHPTLSVRIGNEHCFGCHSRSGRISTSYEGWHETHLVAAAVTPGSGLRLLADGRVFERRPEDVHHAAGLGCIDCHTSREAMGTGASHRHQEQALEVACQDCHASGTPRTLAWHELDAETRAIARLRWGDDPRERRFLVARRSGLALVNVFLDASGRPVLEGKLDGRRHPLKAPVAACVDSGHERLTCSACHAAWAPQCLVCHTQRGLDDTWQEYSGSFLAEPPSLGVRETVVAAGNTGRIEPFAPGMILTLGVEPVALSGADPEALARRGRFERLFAPVAPHTTARAGRSCDSCHRDPLALGYGRGTLRPRPDSALAPGFDFAPTFGSLRDGLPADAWIPFLGERNGPLATRSDARPFSVVEQKRILRVGACLECHEPSLPESQALFADFGAARRRASPRCVVPWPGEP